MVFKLLVLAVACIAFIQPSEAGIGAITSKISNVKTAVKDTVSDMASIVPNMIQAKGGAVIRAAARTGSILATGAGFKVKALDNAASSVTGALADGLLSIGRSLARKGTNIQGVPVNRSVFLGRVEDVRVRAPTYVEEVKVMAPDVAEEVRVARPVAEEVRVMARPVAEEVRVARPVAEEVRVMARPVAEEVRVARPVVEEVRVMARPVTEEVRVMARPVTEEVRVMARPVVEEVKVRAPFAIKEEFVVPCEQEVVEVPVEPYPFRFLGNVRPHATIIEPSPRDNFVAANVFIGNRPSAGRPVFYDVINTPLVFQGPLGTFQIAKK